MKVKITCIKEQIEIVKEAIEDLGIEIISTTDTTDASITVDTSDEGCNLISEIPGVSSVVKSSFLDRFKC